MRPASTSACAYRAGRARVSSWEKRLLDDPAARTSEPRGHVMHLVCQRPCTCTFVLSVGERIPSCRLVFKVSGLSCLAETSLHTTPEKVINQEGQNYFVLLVSRLILEFCNPTVRFRRRWTNLKHFDLCA